MKKLLGFLVFSFFLFSAGTAFADHGFMPRRHNTHYRSHVIIQHRPPTWVAHNRAPWHRGHWTHQRHAGRSGWWWVVGGVWHLYSQPVYPYPNMYAAPLYIAQQNIIETAPSYGSTVSFSSPQSEGLVATPASMNFIDAQGRTCREYQTTIDVGGSTQSAYGTACLQPGGSWRVVQ